ncbi:MAG: hypothetical protein ACK4UJ_07095 [Leptonema sp. (in: bacteria)]
MKYLLILLFIFLLNCKSCNKPTQNLLKKEDYEKCGECLHLQTGSVCTVEGTYFNSCLAICKQIKILCEGDCPCKNEN